MNIRKIIREEMDDFDWMMGPINPWSQYSMLIFDEEPTREEINHYIELALNTGRISNKEAWEIGEEQAIDGILEYIRRDGGAVLKINQWGDLQYTDISYYNSSHNAIRYSQLVNKKINESEEDDLKWIIDIEPQNYQWSATQNLINQTEIIPNAFMGEPMIKVPFTNLQFNKPKHFSNVHTFKDYIKSNYGIEDPLTITNIFNMWSAEINKNLNESEEDGWDWAINSQPLELQDPREWIGSSFGYGQSIIDDMYDYEIERGDDKESFEIVGVEDDILLIVRDHPRFGKDGDSLLLPLNRRVYIGGFIERMNKGVWIWV